MFERVVQELLVLLSQRWQTRQKRTCPVSVVIAKQRFQQLWIVDASTLEALFRKLKSLESSKVGKLGGRIRTINA